MAELSHSGRIRYHFSSKQEEAVLGNFILKALLEQKKGWKGRRLPESFGALLVMQGMRRRNTMSHSTWNDSKCSRTVQVAGGSWWLLHNAGVSLSPGSVKGIAHVLVLKLDAGKMGFLREESFLVFSTTFHVLSPFWHLCSTRWQRSLGEAAVLPGVRGLRDAAWQNPLQQLSENGCTFLVVHTVSFWSFLMAFFFSCRFVAFRGISLWHGSLSQVMLS